MSFYIKTSDTEKVSDLFRFSKDSSILARLCSMEPFKEIDEEQAVQVLQERGIPFLATEVVDGISYLRHKGFDFEHQLIKIGDFEVTGTIEVPGNLGKWEVEGKEFGFLFQAEEWARLETEKNKQKKSQKQAAK